MEPRLAFAAPTKCCAPRRVSPLRPAVLVFRSEDVLSSTRDRLGPALRRSPHPGRPSPALQPPPPPGPAPPPSGTRRGHGAVAGPRPKGERRLAALGMGMIRDVRGNEGGKGNSGSCSGSGERPHLSTHQGPSAPPAALPLRPRYSACAGQAAYGARRGSNPAGRVWVQTAESIGLGRLLGTSSPAWGPTAPRQTDPGTQCRVQSCLKQPQGRRQHHLPKQHIPMFVLSSLL